MVASIFGQPKIDLDVTLPADGLAVMVFNEYIFTSSPTFKEIFYVGRTRQRRLLVADWYVIGHCL